MNMDTGELALVCNKNMNDFNRYFDQGFKVFESKEEASEAGFVILDKKLSKDAEAVISSGVNTIPLSSPRNRHERRLMEKRRRVLAKKRPARTMSSCPEIPDNLTPTCPSCHTSDAVFRCSFGDWNCADCGMAFESETGKLLEPEEDLEACHE